MPHRTVGSKRSRGGTRQPPDETLYQHCIAQCPRDWFRACFIVWHSVAAFRMVVADSTEHPQASCAPLHGKLRSAYAVKEFLGDCEELLPPIINRILAISTLIPALLADPKFSPFMHCDSESGVAMSESLLEAFAEAPFAAGTLTYDVDALYSITVRREFAAQHPTAN